jgi:hypothetical protein
VDSAAALGASFLALSLFAGFFSSFLTSALAGADAVGAGVAGALAGSAAKADNAKADTMIAITDFILKFPLCCCTQRIFPAYIYNALVRLKVYNKV